LAVHEIPLERRTLHGHFSRGLAPVVTIAPGDSIVFSTLDSGWGLEGGSWERRRFPDRLPKLDDGHALVGPVAVSGARAGQTLAVTVEELRVGDYGFTDAAGWSSWLNQRLGLDDGVTTALWWTLDADAGTGTNQHGHVVSLRPFLGVMGMPPPHGLEVHSTTPPRRWGGNLDCTELGVGSTLYLPIPVDGALFSAGDGHALQGDGEVSGLAIECPMERVRLRLDVRDDLPLRTPIARTEEAWIVLGLDEDLDDAAFHAVDGMVGLIVAELGLDRRDALALASVVVDLRVTQVVNVVKGVHAVLRHDALR
jgi:acetamidase/formamidase